MNDNVRKVFEMLGVKVYDEFKLDDGQDTLYRIDENLWVYYRVNDSWEKSQLNIGDFLNGNFEIAKLPKKKKLRDLTVEEYKKWFNKNCCVYNGNCCNCPFNSVSCLCGKYCWVYSKDSYSDKFLDQEVEIPQEEK